MATYLWSDYESGGGSISPFDPEPTYDVLDFDDHFGLDITAGLGPNDFEQFDFYTDTGAESFFSFGGVTVEVAVDPRKLTTANVTFDTPSLFIFGDNTTGTVNDDAANTLTGGDGGDRLIGAGGDDSVNGGGGNDMLVVVGAGAVGDGLYGDDTIDGGAGVDQIFYDGAVHAINIDLAIGVATGGDHATASSTLTVVNVEYAMTGEGNDTIAGSTAANWLSGEEGNDRILGDTGDDTLDGGLGSDTMYGGFGDDVYFVGSLDDQLSEFVNEGTDKVNSSVTWTLGDHQDNLTLTGDGVIDGTGNSLANVIIGNGEANVLTGGEGDDSIVGAGGNDTLQGNGGDDTLDGGSGDDSMIGGDGDDVFFVVEDGDAARDFDADGGTDTVFTDRSIDLADNNYIEILNWAKLGGGGFCRGNNLDNILIGVGQAVEMNGEGGIDTISYEFQEDSVTINLEEGFADAIGTDSVIGCENALGGLGDDSLIGDGIDNVLDGNDGADTMAGGYGDDTYVVDDAADLVQEDDNDVAPGGLVLPGPGGPGLAGIDGITDTVLAAINFSLESVNFVENVRLTGAAALATGNTLANELVGNSLANTLSGAGGDDTLDGGTGNDTMSGGTGNDTYIVNAAGDVVTEGATGGGTDTVRASMSETLDANVETLVLTGASVLNGTGNSLANRLNGNGAANRLSGLVGNDTLDGAGGNDTLDGGAGNDSMNGSSGNDVYIVDAATDKVVDSAGTDLVRSAVTITTLASGIESLLFTGAGAINGTGNASNNTITGNNAANVLNGGGGADNLNGGAGNDTLVWSPADTYNGGAGTDTLRLAAGALNLKTIADTKILSVEKVDLKGDGNNTLTLARADVLAMSSTDTLTVVGDAGDRVTATGFTQIADLGAYNRYTSGAATLLVESDVTVVL